MFYYGHFCLLIIAQEKWKENYQQKILEKVSSNFLSVLVARNEAEEKRLGWEETPKDPLFNPKNYENCKICSGLTQIFYEKKGINNGLVLFSHTVPDAIGFKSFFTSVFEEKRIKKVLYYELDDDEKIDKKNIPEEKVSLSEVFTSIENKKFQKKVLYEIIRKIF